MFHSYENRMGNLIWACFRWQEFCAFARVLNESRMAAVWRDSGGRAGEIQTFFIFLLQSETKRNVSSFAPGPKEI